MLILYLIIEKVEQRIFIVKLQKALGDNRLLVIVQKQIQLVVKDRVLLLFQILLDNSKLPIQQKNTKIILLKKLNKGDYIVVKAQRLILLLSTLGKVLKLVITKRILYIVKTFRLLSINYFRARKKYSIEQALLLLQEYIYNVQRARKVLSLISFNIKRVYNRVYKERLLQRLVVRGILLALVRQINTFYLERIVTILVNSLTSK